MTTVFASSFSAPQAPPPPSSATDTALPFAASRAASARALLALGDDYGDEAARELAHTLAALRAAGFAKAQATDYSVFDRILGGICWLLQRIVRREDAFRGRVQWELLFQPHDKMRPRLGLAQDVVRCVDALPFAYAHKMQPHQLLLQGFGDIGAVKRLVEWLIELQSEAGGAHLEQIRTKKEHLKLQNGDHSKPVVIEPLKREVRYLQKAYEPRRKYQYTCTSASSAATADQAKEAEDALVQKCLLEYGERVAAAAIVETPPAEADDAGVDEDGDPHRSLIAQLAAASAAAVSRRGAAHADYGSDANTKTKKKTRAKTKDARDFDAQYQRIVQQAMVEQAALLEKQRAREAELLQQVVALPDVVPFDMEDSVTTTSEEIEAEEAKLRDHQGRLVTLEDAKQRLQVQREEQEAQELAMAATLVELKAEKVKLEAEERVADDKPYLLKLRALIAKNEALKKQKTEFKATCKSQLSALQVRVEQLRQQTKQEAAQQDEDTLRLNEIEQMHTHMAAKHKELQLALGRQTRQLNKRMKQIDDVPTRIELIQYEMRFLELYNEVALTLDETRKYYTVYNTLKTTHEFLEKEISLINSMHDNFDLAMASKPATQAFFSQLDTIIANVETSVRKQQTLRADHQTRVETLDSKYQVLQESERMYVNAIREFQKECEKNEKLSAKLVQYQYQYQRHKEQSASVEKPGVAPDDNAVI